jgi:GTP cyclohydrolase IB
MDYKKLETRDLLKHPKFGLVIFLPKDIDLVEDKITVKDIEADVHIVLASECKKPRLSEKTLIDFRETFNENSKIKSKELPDIQQQTPTVKVALNRVGISDFKMPTKVATKEGNVNSTTAVISCYIDLAKELKGINMSRIPQSLHKFQNRTLNSDLIRDIAENIRVVSKAEVCELSYTFDYFLTKISPVNKEPGLVNYPVTFTGIKSKDKFTFKFEVRVTATSLCPCSKEISQFGAHNQKCNIDITCQRKSNAFIWIEDIIKIGENASSCEIFSVLKRPDEKWITEEAYNNPKFVEDVARDCYSQLIENKNIEKFKVKVSSDESIHMHQAVAIIET